MLHSLCSKQHCCPPNLLSRYGVLPQLSRHYHAASLRWPIGDGMGITQLFLPAGWLSTQVGWGANALCWMNTHGTSTAGAAAKQQKSAHPAHLLLPSCRVLCSAASG